MDVTRIKLSHFRNYTSLDVRLSRGLNVFTGRNAQGKTNLLESIYLSGVGRSARTTKDRELIQKGFDRAEVLIELNKKEGAETVEIIVSEREKKRVLIGGVPILRIGELMGAVSVIYFSPDEIKLIKEGPSERRRFMDIDISQLSRAYFYALLKYNNIVSQRNKLLKNLDGLDTLDIWDAELAKEGARLIKARRGFVQRLKPHAKEAHEFLTEGAESLEVEYKSTQGIEQDEIKENLLAELKASRRRDREHGYTHVGPHKDDIVLSINHRGELIDLRSFGSQGQQRTAALSLKLAELNIFTELLGEPPILLLDDVMSELDEKRRELLLKRITSVQTVITATELPIPPTLPATLYTVTNGTIKKA